MGELDNNFTDLPDLGLWLTSFGIILLVTGLIQTGSRTSSNPFYWRKALHIIAISICGFTINQSHQAQVLGYLFLLIGLVLLWVVKNKVLNISKGQSWGVALFPIAFGVLLVGELADIRYIATGAFVLAFSDSIAGMIGYRYGKKKWTPLGEEKSLAGSLAFYGLTLFVILAFHPFFYVAFPALLLICFILTCGELFSSRGSDNLSIPLLTSLLLQQLNQGEILVLQSWVVLLSGVLVLPIMVKKQWLNVGGALAALVLGLCIALYLPWHYLIYPVLFLAMGSLLSKLNRQEERESKGRNAVQVFANGGVALFVLFFFKSNIETLFILVFSIAMADTFSSECGRFIKGNTWNILTLKPMEVGLSGGISFQGTFAGLIAAFILPILAYIMGHLLMNQVIWVGIASFIGMLLDSILGSSIQAKYRSGSQILERKEKEAVLVHGFATIDNDGVNVLSILMVICTYAIIT